MSIDETDNLFHHSTTPDEMSHLVGMIPEEVVDEMHGIWQPEKNETKDEYNAEIGIKRGHMKTIPTADSFVSSSPVPIMCTPTLGGDYMPMSPANLDSSKLCVFECILYYCNVYIFFSIVCFNSFSELICIQLAILEHHR